VVNSVRHAAKVASAIQKPSSDNSAAHLPDKTARCAIAMLAARIAVHGD